MGSGSSKVILWWWTGVPIVLATCLYSRGCLRPGQRYTCVSCPPHSHTIPTQHSFPRSGEAFTESEDNRWNHPSPPAPGFIQFISDLQAEWLKLGHKSKLDTHTSQQALSHFCPNSVKHSNKHRKSRSWKFCLYRAGRSLEHYKELAIKTHTSGAGFLVLDLST